MKQKDLLLAQNQEHENQPEAGIANNFVGNH